METLWKFGSALVNGTISYYHLNTFYESVRQKECELKFNDTSLTSV